MASPFPPLDPARADEDKGPSVVSTITVVVAISTIVAAARLYVRGWITRKFQFDDYLILASVILSWMSVGFTTAAVNSGSGQHIQTLHPDQLSGAIKNTLIGFVPGILSYLVPKFAVAYLLSRLLNPSRLHITIIWAMCIFCFFTMMASCGIAFSQCLPTRSQWDFSIKSDSCYSKWITVRYSQAASAFSAFLDFYLAVYPAVVLYSLQLPTKKKIALSGALGIGSIATLVAIYKITVLPSLAAVDFTYDSCDLSIWTIVEGSVIIIAACIPLLQPLVERFRIQSWTAWSSKDSPGSAYLTPSAGSRRQGYTDIEMSHERSRVNKIRRKFDMESALDNDDGLVKPSESSHDRIPEEDESNFMAAATGNAQSGNTFPPGPHQGITRTKEVSVHYEKDGARVQGPRAGW
ncbi:hypothetical protein DL771_002327 [Monosporascus sp. 5C6A]|nr:hypothetical protein DL771_002327 [Monosporascus sp. 5C6A]